MKLAVGKALSGLSIGCQIVQVHKNLDPLQIFTLPFLMLHHWQRCECRAHINV